MATPKPPRKRRLGTALGALALVVVAVMGFAEYRAWQVRASCSDGGGTWNRDDDACTFRGTAVPAAPTGSTP